MTADQTAAERALASLLAPRRGTVACQVPDDVARETLAGAYAGPCAWTGTSADQAARHTDAAAKAAETRAGTRPKPGTRGDNTGHRYVSPARGAVRAAEREAIGNVRAAALIASMEEPSE